MTDPAVHDLAADRLAELLAELFARSSERGHLHESSTVRRALRAGDFLDHVKGRGRIGAVPFVNDTHVTWAMVDLDVKNWGFEPDAPESIAMVDGVVQGLAAVGLYSVAERSKGKGWHVWTFFSEPVPAQDVRALLRRVALEAGAHNEPDLVCPRQDHCGDVGNGAYLPLFGGDQPAPH